MALIVAALAMLAAYGVRAGRSGAGATGSLGEESAIPPVID